MNQESLKKLARVSDVQQLRWAIEALCLPFGDIRYPQIVDRKERKEYLCIVEIDSRSGQSSVAERLGGVPYGTSVLLRVPFSQ